MYQMTEMTYEELTDVKTALERIINRAKYYKDPVSFDAVQSAYDALISAMKGIRFDENSDYLKRSWEL